MDGDGIFLFMTVESSHSVDSTVMCRPTMGSLQLRRHAGRAASSGEEYSAAGFITIESPKSTAQSRM